MRVHSNGIGASREGLRGLNVLAGSAENGTKLRKADGHVVRFQLVGWLVGLS